MRWRRRPRAAAQIVEADAFGPVSAGTALEPRLERIVVALAVYAQQLDDRLHQLERSIASCHDVAGSLPTQDDLLDVRVHSARVAADLARLRIELSAQIDARVHPDPRARRVNALAETILDLSDGWDTRGSDLAASA